MVKYLAKPEPPRSHSVAFLPADEQSSYEALILCLIWVWRVHKRCTQEECPHNLGVPL